MVGQQGQLHIKTFKLMKLLCMLSEWHTKIYSVRINATPPLMSLRRCPPPAPRMHHHTHTRTKALACMSHALCSCDKCCALKVPSQLHIRKQRMSLTNDASAWASGLVETHHTALVMFMHGDAGSFMRRIFLPLFVH